ncbi:type II secretion system protein [Vibrio alginolyticus]|uniref:type II secretion system protein n=1 Tax=Vibrio sp. B1FLJ16 TaxID=2751178 RepID=UPI0015F51115|nr:type II secretion system protein [Vibrio sp. B1FLJ16]CAD7802590.1 Prokaryotic N-terminal methylation motif [Vibrio sp. B1FLJ16]CAD7802737.1 Prokaryotic N-terminal methylation motif [Vibrio sp. B1FLJ16]CAE6892925.1 Prokaryotic N-terminal methylation motif [Vibrio sp. B1FLJ16]CAE6894200.1 Prokaryotic N-terminal methylation motif [Vibrio sp. B1FLJ16]
MRRQKGFTLIELVIVIVILGILSVVAVPKFLNVQDDARASTIKGIKATLQVVIDSVHAQSLIQGTEKQREVQTEVNGVYIQTYYGYPQEIWDDKLEHLMSHTFNYLGNGYNNNSLYSTTCDYSVCVVDQIKLSELYNDNTGGYALAFFPKGKSLQDNCVAVYYFTAYESDGFADVHVESRTSEC